MAWFDDRKRDSVELTSMVDVTFLLLIFFMVIASLASVVCCIVCTPHSFLSTVRRPI